MTGENKLKEAAYYEKLKDKAVVCNLCPNYCRLAEGKTGICRARKNVGGKLYSLVYGKIASRHIDPVEKKPLYHFLPGTEIYSIATTGCNLRCKFCQNWQISQAEDGEAETEFFTPEEVVGDALKNKVKAIAFTYNEPTIYYEYMLEIAKLARKKGLKTAVISAGYINQEPLKKLLPYIDAYKIDFKGFSEDFYKNLTGGKLEPVLETMKTIKKSGTWLEIVNLVVTGHNDSDGHLKGLALWVKDNLGEDTPLHFTRFQPDYKLTNVPPTPVITLKKAREMAMKAGLRYVYAGNISDPASNTTFCPKSGEPAIIRNGFFVMKNSLDKNGKCPDGSKVPGVWK